MRKAFVLLSGGLDSTTCLYQAIHDYAPSPEAAIEHIDGTRRTLHRPRIDWVEAISVDYGQRHKKEFSFAQQTCKQLGVQHSLIHVGDILSGSGVMLTDASVAIPSIAYSDIKGVSPTYVPFRNGTLLSLITAYAQKWVNQQIDMMVDCKTDVAREIIESARDEATKRMKDSAGIYFGAHNEDAFNWAYPDCTPEFIGSMANAIYTGTYYAVRLHTPLQWLSKADVVTLGNKLGVPFENTWSCYAGEEKQCGICPTCRARKEAFRIANVQDPAEYAQ